MSFPIRQYAQVLGAYLRPQRARVTVLALLLLAGIGLQLLNPQLMRAFVDGALAGADESELLTTALLFIGVALVTQTAAVGTTYLSEGVGWTATNALRADLAAHVLAQDLAFHKERTPGELIERIDGDVTALASFFSQLVVTVIGNLLLLLGVLVLLAGEDWRLGLLFAAFAALALLALLPLRGRAVAAWTAYRQANARLFGLLGEHLSGTEDLRANGATGYSLHRFTELARWQLPIVRRAEMAEAGFWLASNGVAVIGTVLAASASILLWQAGALSVGGAVMLFAYLDLVRRPIEQLRAQMQEMQKASASLNRVGELFALRPSIVDGAGPDLPSGALALSLDRLSFAYEDDVPVLRDLTLDLPPGAVLGLLGRTGSGKTTLARLLLRFVEPRAGAVRLGGLPLPDTRLVDLRRRVGVVTQEVQLFEGSVRDNLSFFDHSIPDERILAALTELGLDDWLASLPEGLETVLLAGGLSAGEAQLLALARLLLRDPGLVILDEASSRLDPATEARLERAVDRLLAGRTAIIIAHRLATVARADQILVLEEGRALEYGERAHLAADPSSRFAGLLRTGGLREVLA